MLKNNLKPIIYIEIYLTSTLVLYLITPLDFPTKNSFLTFFLILLSQLFLFIGYYISEKYPTKIRKTFWNENTIIKILKKLIIIYFFVLIIKIVRASNLAYFNIHQIIDLFFKSLSTPSYGYYNLHIGETNLFLGSIGTIIITLAGFFSYAIIPLILLYFNKFTKFFKLFSILIVFLSAVEYVVRGTNKGIFDIVLFFISIYFINLQINFKKKKQKSLKFYIIVSISFILLLNVFTFFIGSRSIGQNWKNNYVIANQVKINYNAPIMKILSEPQQQILVLTSTYLSQGYYGFSLATTVDWSPTFGLGHSLYFLDELEEHGIKLVDNSLTRKISIKYNWDDHVQWSSIYTWIANDVSIYGVPIIFFIFGFLISRVYRSAIIEGNVFAKILFSFFMIECFFIPANDQLFVRLDTILSLITVFLLWRISRKISIKW